MNIRLYHVAIGVGLICLMTFLFFETNMIDSRVHNSFSSNLRHLKEIDATLDKNILESRYGLLNSYDLMNSEANQIHQLETSLKNIPEFVNDENRERIKNALSEYETLQEQKESLIDRYKSRNAIINNSLRYFPVTTSNLIKTLSTEGSDKNELAGLNSLLRDVLIYYLLTEPGLEKEILGEIEALKKFERGDPKSEINSALNISVSHARSILKLKPEVDGLVRETVSIPTAGQIEDVIEIYDSSYNRALSRASTSRLFLYIFSILLLTFIGYIILKLKKVTFALHALNENLELLVEARTVELSKSHSELQKSETNNRALIKAIPDSMWHLNKEGVFLDFISADEDKTTAEISDWVGKTIFEILPTAVAEKTMQMAELSLATGNTQVFEYQIVKNEKASHFEGRLAVCGESEILTIIRDITEVKQAGAESQVISEIIQGINTTSNLDELLTHIHQSIAKLLYAENCFVALYDRKTELLDMQFFIDKFDDAPPAVKLGKGLTSYVFRKGVPMLMPLQTVNSLIDDGEIIMVGTPPAVWLGVPLRTPDGIIGVFAIQHYEDGNAYNQRDLEFLTAVGDQIALAIERKWAEDALKASEARFQSAFDYAPIGIGLTSTDGNWIQVNRSLCDILGYAKEELLNTNFQTITHQENLPESIACMKRLLAGEVKTCRIEKRYVHKLGHQVLALTSLSVVRDSQNDPLYIISQIQDITEQKALEDQLMRGQKLESIGQLAAGIAHEINTPTQYVGDNTRFLKDGFQDLFMVLSKNQLLFEACQTNSVTPTLITEMEKAIKFADLDYLSLEVPKAIDQALHGVERISKIVQSMKDFAHPGSADKKATDLNKAIESTITVASNEWKYLADMETNFDPNLPSVPVMLGEFNQVILNMVINASHAISDVVGDGSNGKGKITIGTKLNGEKVEIRISDTGTGIPKDVCKKIFDPFFTTKEVGKGTGQGLAISHSIIVEKHKGNIAVESVVGEGTTFIISLPSFATAG